jgi:hypothetical protein
MFVIWIVGTIIMLGWVVEKGKRYNLWNESPGWYDYWQAGIIACAWPFTIWPMFYLIYMTHRYGGLP